MSCDFCKKADFGNFSAKVDNISAGIYLAGGSYRFPIEEQFVFCPVCGKCRVEQEKTENLSVDSIARDFLDSPLYLGDYVVAMVHSRTSSVLRTGTVTALTQKTAMVKTEYGERRFAHDKLVKIGANI